MRVRLKSPYWRRICSLFDHGFFFVGVILLLFVAAADLCVGVGCRQLGPRECVELVEEAQSLAATAELGGEIQMPPRQVSAVE